MCSGVTKYIICVTSDKLAKSQKVRQSLRFRTKPAIVNLDWFIDCLEACQMIPTDTAGSRYLIPTEGVFGRGATGVSGAATSNHS